MNGLDEIRDEVMRDGFPELIHLDIQVEYVRLEDALLEYGELSPEGYYVEVEETLRNTNRLVLVGGMAHELAHIADSASLSRFGNFEDGLLHRVSSRYRILDERNVDLQAILRGFGPALLEFLEYAKRAGFPRYEDDGLSIKEVRVLLGD